LPIIELVDFAFNFYILLLFARIIMSWIRLPDNPMLNTLTSFIYDVTEPFLGLFRRLLPIAQVGGMGMDFSPILAFFVLRLIQSFVIKILMQSL
jgi:YggT family protein